MLYHALDKKVLNRKLQFWLPFRALKNDKNKGTAYLKELKIDYGKGFTKEELEKQLASRINKIELKKIEANIKDVEKEFENDTSLEESKLEEDALTKIKRKISDLPMDPVQMMEMNLANISAI